LAEREQIIRKWKASGKSLWAFSLVCGISQPTLTRWIGQEADRPLRQLTVVPAAEFVAEVVFPNGTRVRVHAQCHGQQLSQILQAARK